MTILCSIQIADATVKQLGEAAEQLSRRVPGMKVTRTQVIRQLLGRTGPRA